MGFFSKIAKAIKPGASSDDSELLRPLETLNRNNRLHPRYFLPENGLASLRLPDGTSGPILDLSYGGVAAVFAKEVTVDPKRLPQNLEATLTLLDRSISCQLTPSRMVPKEGDKVLVGFRLRHDTPDALLFLREFIEPMRCGLTLADLPADFRKDRYRTPEWACLRGDGPVDVLVRVSLPAKKLEEAMLTFKMNDAYCELSFRDGVLRTGRSASEADSSRVAVGTQMNLHASIDKAAVRHAIAVIVGAPTGIQPMLASLLIESLRALSLGADHAAA